MIIDRKLSGKVARLPNETRTTENSKINRNAFPVSWKVLEIFVAARIVYHSDSSVMTDRIDTRRL